MNDPTPIDSDPTIFQAGHSNHQRPRNHLFLEGSQSAVSTEVPFSVVDIASDLKLVGLTVNFGADVRTEHTTFVYAGTPSLMALTAFHQFLVVHYQQ